MFVASNPLKLLPDEAATKNRYFVVLVAEICQIIILAAAFVMVLLIP